MKIIGILLFAATLLSACGNETGKKPEDLRSKADSLYDEVMEGHDFAMPKTIQLGKVQARAKQLLDSIAKLPAEARQAAGPFKARLDTLLNELDLANQNMTQWMENFRYDSAENDLEQRIRYLADEKVRVEKVKVAILNSLHKADSLIGKIN